MEEEYPEMTERFKELQAEQYELFVRNNTIMVQAIYQ